MNKEEEDAVIGDFSPVEVIEVSTLTNFLHTVNRDHKHRLPGIGHITVVIIGCSSYVVFHDIFFGNGANMQEFGFMFILM